MIIRRTPLFALMLLAAALPPTTSLAPSSWTSSFTISSHSREFSVTSTADGVPQLEPGEVVADDPSILVDEKAWTSVPLTPTPSDPTSQPEPSSELDEDDAFDPLVPEQDAPQASTEAEVPAPSGAPTPTSLQGPQMSVTPPPRGEGPGEANSQVLLGSDSDEASDPRLSPEPNDPTDPVGSLPDLPDISSTPLPSSSPTRVTTSTSPKPSKSFVTISTPTPAMPSIVIEAVISQSPGNHMSPSSASRAPEITIIPTKSFSPTASQSVSPLMTQSAALSPKPSVPSPSATPLQETQNVEAALASISPPVILSSSPSAIPSPSPSRIETAILPQPGNDFVCIFFGAGKLPAFKTPVPASFSGTFKQYAAKQNRFPSLSPQYLSHTYGKAWSYSVPVMPNSSYEFVLGFAEVFNEACAAGSGFRKFSVSLADQIQQVDAFAEAGCGKPLKKTFSIDSNGSTSVIAKLQGSLQHAMLSTMCYREKDRKSQQTITPSPEPSISTPVASFEESAIVVPDSEYQCYSFGPRAFGSGYKLFEKSSVLGETEMYRGSGINQNPTLPWPYRYHVYGKKWRYRFSTSSDAPHRLVLGFAEVFPNACASGAKGSFRVFTVTVNDEVRIMDVMKNSGCLSVEQIAFENVLPKNGRIDVSFSAISGNAMLSVLCAKEMVPRGVPLAPSKAPSPVAAQISALPLSSPSSTETPTAGSAQVPSLAPSSQEATPSPVGGPEAMVSAIPPSPSAPVASMTSSPSERGAVGCFKFGDGIVSGFTNVELPEPGSGVDFYRNQFSVVKGTPYNSVYSSHVYGEVFTLSVRTGSTAVKTVLLGFAEIFQPACSDGFRVFEVKTGSTLKTIDVYKDGGCNTAFDLQIEGVAPSADGVIDITFKARGNNAMLSAACIVDDLMIGESNAIGVQGPPTVTTGVTIGDIGLGTNSIGAKAISVSAGEPGTGSFPSPGPPQSGQPSAKPGRSPLPKENGVIIAPPMDDPTPSPSTDSVLIGLDITSQDVGVVSPSPFAQRPTPSDTLVPVNSSLTTTGVVGGTTHSPSPVASAPPTPPGESSIEASQTDIPDSGAEDVTPTPRAVLILGGGGSGPSSPVPPPQSIPSNEDGNLPEESPGDFSDDEEPLLPSENPSAVPDKADSDPVPTTPIIGPTVTAIPMPSISATPSSVATSSPTLATVAPLGTILATPNPDSEMDTPPVLVPTNTPSPTESANPASSTPAVATATVSAVPGNDTELDTTAIPPGSGVVGNASSDPVRPNQGDLIVSSPEISPSGTLAPSPVGSRQPNEILPPLDASSTPVPSSTPVILEFPSTFPTVTPTPTETPPSPTPSGTPLASIVLSPLPSPSDVSEGPSGVVIGPAVTPGTGESSSTGVPASVSPIPSASQITSTTGSNDVIITGTDAPTPDPKESEAPVAPANPISAVPNNDTNSVIVNDGSEIDGSTTNPDAGGDGSDGQGPTIIAGPYKDLIATRGQGNGFAIGMGILGSLLLLLLLVCLFFAIFRSRGGSYSYSSQYSAHKPSEYDPSQGGYTDDLGPATGEYGNESVYGTGAQDGYGGETLESRPQTQNGSFTYEGATDPDGTIGSGYGQGVPGEGYGGTSGSAYGNTEPDTFAEYSSLNIQAPSGGSPAHRGHTGEYTTDETFAMPSTGAYQAETGDARYDVYRDSGHTTRTSAQRATECVSDSFNVNHSIAQPMASASGSSGTHERYSASAGYEETGTSDNIRVSPGNPASSDASEMNVLDRHTNRHSQQVLSMSSNPSVGKSPYESGFDLDVHPGNVTKGNPLFPRTPSTDLSGTPVLRPETPPVSERIDSELRNDFLCNDAQFSRTGFLGPSKVTHETRAQGLHAEGHSSQESNDGPWPFWWSDKMKVSASISPGTNGAEGNGIPQQLAVPNTKWEGSSDEVKENESLSSNGVIKSIFREDSARDRSPFGRSEASSEQRPAYFPVKPSQIISDSGWRHQPLDTVDDSPPYENNPDFDELRRRREPYVKAVAKRLSYGPRAYSSTSSSGDTPLAFPQGKFDQGQFAPQPGDPRASVSWISENVH